MLASRVFSFGALEGAPSAATPKFRRPSGNIESTPSDTSLGLRHAFLAAVDIGDIGQADAAPEI